MLVVDWRASSIGRVINLRQPHFSTGEQNVGGCVAQALEIVLDLFTVWIARYTTVG